MTVGRYSVIIAIVATVMVATAQADMWLTMLPGAAQNQGAVCLDGNPTIWNRARISILNHFSKLCRKPYGILLQTCFQLYLRQQLDYLYSG
jgi:hypothetical protein